MADKLAKVNSFSAIAPLSSKGSDLFDQSDVMADNLGAGGVSPSQLDRVKVPSGGGTAWEIPTLDGKGDVAKELEVIIVAARDVRAYYKDKYDGGNSAPDCYSLDCVVGIGYPGGDCATCPFAQWGSAVDDNGNATDGQACNQRKMTMNIQADSVLPFVVSFPPSSIKEIQKYFLRLAGSGLPYWGVVTKLTLEKTKSGSGIEYSVVKPQYVRTLTESEIPSMKAYRSSLLPMFNLVTPEPKAQAQPDDIDSE